MQLSDFSSLPPEEEQSFVVFEEQSRSSASTALTVGIVTGAIVFFLAIIIRFAFGGGSHEPSPADSSQQAKPAAQTQIHARL